MSDREMRDILQSVIDDIDEGRLRVLRRNPALLRKLGAPALAAAIALGTGACMAYGAPEYGVPPVDAAVDSAVEVDADMTVEYAAPFLPPAPKAPEDSDDSDDADAPDAPDDAEK